MLHKCCVETGVLTCRLSKACSEAGEVLNALVFLGNKVPPPRGDALFRWLFCQPEQTARTSAASLASGRAVRKIRHSLTYLLGVLHPAGLESRVLGKFLHRWPQWSDTAVFLVIFLACCAGLAGLHSKLLPASREPGTKHPTSGKQPVLFERLTPPGRVIQPNATFSGSGPSL